jgi:ribonuclease G
MERELIVQQTAQDIEIALLENGKLVELHKQEPGDKYAVGDIVLGRVKKLMPNLNGAFVDIGHAKDAFLHYHDLGPDFKSLERFADLTGGGHNVTHLLENFKLEPQIDKNGKIEQVLTKRQQVVVQIFKEPISSKGYRLSAEVTIPGRFLVLTPFSNTVAISKKISSSDERKRLVSLVESIRPKNFGVIIRTAAEGKKVADLHEELLNMMEKWEGLYENLRQSTAPKKLFSELDKTSSILRDLLNASFSKVLVDNRDVYNSVKSYMMTIAPDKVDIIQLVKGKAAFDHANVTRQIKQSFGKTAPMVSGAYLVIEHTEAMHVIDVNSGHKVTNLGFETAAFNVNMEAVTEVARQLRLRDIGGIIIIDFIDMKNLDQRKAIFGAMRDAMVADRAQHTILPLSKFGLMQITRQRTKPQITINTSENCPTCHGTGKITASILLTDDIQRDYETILKNTPRAKVALQVHPYLEAWFKRGLLSNQVKWSWQYKRWLKIVGDENMPMNSFKFVNQHKDDIRLQPDPEPLIEEKESPA